MNDKEQRAEFAQFLRIRREHVAPQHVGLQPGTRRRTPGLRREELAQLAGVGATWYTWLEQGRAITVSGQVLESLARVLQLDADERAYLFILARWHLPVDAPPPTHTLDPALQLIVDMMGIYPAWILSRRWDIMAWNRAARRILGDVSAMPSQERHLLWLLFTDPRYRAMAVDWEQEAQLFLALFRASTQCYVGEVWLTELVTALKQVSPAFHEWWSRYDIQGVQTGHKHMIHPVVGLLVLQAKTFQVADHPGLQMIVYTPVPGTDTAAKLALLSQSSSEE